MKDTETFIDKTNNVKNIEKVNIPKADNDQEAKDDPRIVLESVQKTVHVVARFAGCGVSPPTSAPRDTGLTNIQLIGMCLFCNYETIYCQKP